MPGFTADDSMYTKHGIGVTHVTVSQNTTERIQPAMRYNCFNLGTIVGHFIWDGNLGMAFFWAGIAKGLGCKI